MYQFIKLTQATVPHASVWINPSHISEMRVLESTNRTILIKTADQDQPVEVSETPDQVNALIRQAVVC